MDYRLIFTLVVIGLLFAGILMTGSFVVMLGEHYKKATGFTSGNRFITITEDGDIVLQPVKDVDTAIDTAAGSIAADVSTTYQTKSAASSIQAADGRTFQTKADAAAMKKTADTAYQPTGNYLTRGKFYRIWNKDGEQNVLRWGDQIKTDGNKNATDQYRYFKIDN